MQEKKYWSVEEFQCCMKMHGNFLLTRKKIAFEILPGDGLSISYLLRHDKQKKYRLDLVWEFANLPVFLASQSISGVGSLENITPAHLWTQYITGNAHVRCHLEYIQIPVNFRLHKSTTMIYSKPLQFYGEVNKPLSMTTQFIEWTLQHQSHLYDLAEQRLKVFSK